MIMIAPLLTLLLLSQTAYAKVLCQADELIANYEIVLGQAENATESLREETYDSLMRILREDAEVCDSFGYFVSDDNMEKIGAIFNRTLKIKVPSPCVQSISNFVLNTLQKILKEDQSSLINMILNNNFIITKFMTYESVNDLLGIVKECNPDFENIKIAPVIQNEVGNSNNFDVWKVLGGVYTASIVFNQVVNFFHTMQQTNAVSKTANETQNKPYNNSQPTFDIYEIPDSIIPMIEKRNFIKKVVEVVETTSAVPSLEDIGAGILAVPTFFGPTNTNLSKSSTEIGSDPALLESNVRTVTDNVPENTQPKMSNIEESSLPTNDDDQIKNLMTTTSRAVENTNEIDLNPGIVKSSVRTVTDTVPEVLPKNSEGDMPNLASTTVFEKDNNLKELVLTTPPPPTTDEVPAITVGSDSTSSSSKQDLPLTLTTPPPPTTTEVPAITTVLPNENKATEQETEEGTTEIVQMTKDISHVQEGTTVGFEENLQVSEVSMPSSTNLPQEPSISTIPPITETGKQGEITISNKTVSEVPNIQSEENENLGKPDALPIGANASVLTNSSTNLNNVSSNFIAESTITENVIASDIDKTTTTEKTIMSTPPTKQPTIPTETKITRNPTTHKPTTTEMPKRVVKLPFWVNEKKDDSFYNLDEDFDYGF